MAKQVSYNRPAPEADALCAGCAARHHERCTGWTRTYRRRDDGALALAPCTCVSHMHNNDNDPKEGT